MFSEASKPPGPIRDSRLLIKIRAIIKAAPFVLDWGVLNWHCYLTTKHTKQRLNPKLPPLCFQPLRPLVLLMDPPSAKYTNLFFKKKMQDIDPVILVHKHVTKVALFTLWCFFCRCCSKYANVLICHCCIVVVLLLQSLCNQNPLL